MTAAELNLGGEPDVIDFGELPEEVNDLLQRGVVAYRHDRAAADALFRQALALAPDQLAIYFCLYKTHTYRGNLDEALAVAEAGLARAATQAGWPLNFEKWQPTAESLDGPARVALYTLKAIAFIRLRRGEAAEAEHALGVLSQMDPCGTVGWPVVAELACGIAAAPAVTNAGGALLK